MREMFNNLRNWWRRNRRYVEASARRTFYTLVDVFDSIIGFIDFLVGRVLRIIFIGILLNVMVSTVYPEFAERFPAIYGFYDGFIQLGEFLVTYGFKALHAIFTGHWGEFDGIGIIQTEFHQFVNWIQNLHF